MRSQSASAGAGTPTDRAPPAGAVTGASAAGLGGSLAGAEASQNSAAAASPVRAQRRRSSTEKGSGTIVNLTTHGPLG